MVLVVQGETPGGRRVTRLLPIQVMRLGVDLTLKVTDPLGRGIGSAWVGLYDSVGMLLESVLTGADGAATIPAVPSGQYTVRARQVDYALKIQPVRVGAQPLDVPVTLEPKQAGRLFIGGIDNSLSIIDTASWCAAQMAAYSIVRGWQTASSATMHVLER